MHDENVLFIHGRNGGQATAYSENGTEWGIGCMTRTGFRGRLWTSFDRERQVWVLAQAKTQDHARLSDAMHAALEMVIADEAFQHAIDEPSHHFIG